MCVCCVVFYLKSLGAYGGMCFVISHLSQTKRSVYFVQQSNYNVFSILSFFSKGGIDYHASPVKPL